jgi:hypothetical protein
MGGVDATEKGVDMTNTGLYRKEGGCVQKGKSVKYLAIRRKNIKTFETKYGDKPFLSEENFGNHGLHTDRNHSF